MDLSQQQVAIMARAIGLHIPPQELENVRLRLWAMLVAMEEIEREIGAQMDKTDPAPPITLPDSFNAQGDRK